MTDDPTFKVLTVDEVEKRFDDDVPLAVQSYEEHTYDSTPHSLREARSEWSDRLTPFLQAELGLDSEVYVRAIRAYTPDLGMVVLVIPAPWIAIREMGDALRRLVRALMPEMDQRLDVEVEADLELTCWVDWSADPLPVRTAV